MTNKLTHFTITEPATGSVTRLALFSIAGTGGYILQLYPEGTALP